MATEQPRFGVSHVTVVPTNYRREDDSENADEDAAEVGRS